MEWDERKGNGIPSLEDEALVDEVCAFASRQGATSITRLADRSLDKGAEIAAATKLILYAKSSRIAQIPRPLRVDLAFEVECAPLVCHVAGNDKKAKAYPEKECVDCEEGAIVEEDAGPANEGGDDAKRGGEGGYDEFGPVTDPDDVCISPYVKPGQQAKYGGNEGIYRELHSTSVSACYDSPGTTSTHQGICSEECPFKFIPAKLGVGL